MCSCKFDDKTFNILCVFFVPSVLSSICFKFACIKYLLFNSNKLKCHVCEFQTRHEKHSKHCSRCKLDHKIWIFTFLDMNVWTNRRNELSRMCFCPETLMLRKQLCDGALKQTQFDYSLRNWHMWRNNSIFFAMAVFNSSTENRQFHWHSTENEFLQP